MTTHGRVAASLRERQERTQARVDALTLELAECRRDLADIVTNDAGQKARADAAEAEVARLRMEFRRIEECVAGLVAGERCYAQVMKVLHEAPRLAPEVK